MWPIPATWACAFGTERCARQAAAARATRSSGAPGSREPGPCHLWPHRRRPETVLDVRFGLEPPSDQRLRARPRRLRQCVGALYTKIVAYQNFFYLNKKFSGKLRYSKWQILGHENTQ